MNPSPFAKRQIILLAVLFCSIAFLLAIADRAPIHMEKRYPSAHVREEFTFYLDGIVQKTLPGPLVYRVLMPWTITGLQTIAPFMSPLDIDLMMKIFILVVCQASFYFYTRLFFPPFVSLAGVFLLDSLLGFALASIQGPSLIETSDLFNLAIYVLALIALSLNSFRSLLVILFIGTFNRESTWLILPILFVSDFKNRRGLWRSVLASLVVAVPYFGIRTLMDSGKPAWITFEGLARNIPFLAAEHTGEAIMANLHVAALLGPLLILSVMYFKSHPEFLQIAFFITPLFIVVHYALGWVIEARLWMPLFVILIPPALDTLTRTFRSSMQEVHPSVAI